MQPVHEGEKLQKLIDGQHITQKKLAAAGGFTKAAAHRWVKTEEFDRRMWENVRACMIKVKLNPSDIRPEKGAGIVDIASGGKDLTKLVEDWPNDQLKVLKEILIAGDDPRDLLLVYINGALRNVK